jgi:outer membrane protein assembly factor BamE (lipoprotein component of BamABCDE complex)
MKPKRLLLIVAFFASFLLAGYVALRLTVPCNQITEQSLLAIEMGMTEEQVEELFGVPAGDYGSGGGTGWYSSAPKDAAMEKTITYQNKHFFEGTDFVKFLGGKEWVGEDMSVYVQFDQAGRVQEVLRGDVSPTRGESFLAKLRHWLGIR